MKNTATILFSLVTMLLAGCAHKPAPAVVDPQTGATLIEQPASMEADRVSGEVSVGASYNRTSYGQVR